MKLDFIKNLGGKVRTWWSRLNKRQQWTLGIAAGFVLLLGLTSGATKYGGSTILPPQVTISSIAGSMIPSTNNTYDIGSGAKSWKNIYASGTASLKYVSSTAITATNEWLTKLTVTAVSSTRGTATTFWSTKGTITNVSSTLLTVGTSIWENGQRVCLADGTNCPATSWAGGQVTVDVFPNANNTLKLGYATNSWAGIYASGTSYIFQIVSTEINPITGIYPNTAGTAELGSPGSQFHLGAIDYVSSTAISLTTGWFTSLIGTNVTTTNIYLTSGGNIKVNNANAKRTIVLSGAGAWSPTTGGNLGTYQTEMTTNKQNFQYVSFNSSTIQGASWTVVMPDNWDGSTLTAEYYQTATSTCAGNVVWALAATAYNNGDALDAAWGTAVSSTVALDGTANHVSTSTASGAITVGGTPRGGSMVQFKLMHDGLSASETAYCPVVLVMAKIKYGIRSYSD